MTFKVFFLSKNTQEQRKMEAETRATTVWKQPIRWMSGNWYYRLEKLKPRSTVRQPEKKAHPRNRML